MIVRSLNRDKDMTFEAWLDRQTYSERLQLKAWYGMREDKTNLSWESFLREHYENTQ